MKQKLFLVVRADLSPGQQAVQAAHALREWTETYEALDAAWYASSNTLALLSVPDEEGLRSLIMKAWKEGHAVATFSEPDLDGKMTAIAIEPAGWRVCKGLPLALGG